MKRLTVLLMCSMAIALLAACGGKAKEETTAASTAAAPAATAPDETKAPAGTPYDCDKFSLTLANGWAASPLAMGMVNVLPQGMTSPGLYFKFEGDGNAVGTAEGSIGTMIKDYGGSPMETTMIAGVEFKTTTYAHSGMTQTMHVAFRNGTKITVTIEGAGAKDNADIKAMLASLRLK